jgi:hypothetical protein
MTGGRDDDRRLAGVHALAQEFRDDLAQGLVVAVELDGVMASVRQVRVHGLPVRRGEIQHGRS